MRPKLFFTATSWWNTYNYYNCKPSENIVRQNAKGLVDLGLSKLGYTYVTPDCGWNANYRDTTTGSLVWDKSLFPSGGKALGDYIHSLGLKFGVYSGAGYFQCGSKDEPASLGHEATDAKVFADWGADSLKYDNCYSTSQTNMVDYNSAGAVSPTRFQTMASALNTTNRDIIFQVCQWGVGTNIGAWASQIASSWRMSNDISNNWRSIWRITNEVVPYYKTTRVGAYPDMDMMIVGLRCLSFEEERFHFGMWAINKSPLIIGAPTTGSITPATSFQTLSNSEVIAINQDPLGVQAQLVRRYTEEEYDVWAGNLSNSRLIVGLANWRNNSQSVTLNMDSELGIASATARDVWAAQDLGKIAGDYKSTLAGHQLRLLVLSDIEYSHAKARSAGYYLATDAALSGTAAKTSCTNTQCLPSHTKVQKIGPGADIAAVVFSGVTAATSGRKLVGVDFINYDTALDSAWADGSNTRNMTIAVNGGKAKRWAFPISGGDWYETGRLHVYVDGFQAGKNNTVTFKGAGKSDAAPDLVGLEIFE